MLWRMMKRLNPRGIFVQTSPILSHSRQRWLKQKKLVFFAPEPMKLDIDVYESDVAKSMIQIPDTNFDSIHQVDVVWQNHRLTLF